MTPGTTRNALRLLAPILAFAGLSLAASQTYVNKEQGFSITYPSGWVANDQVPGAIVAFLSPTSGTGFSTNVNVVAQAAPGSVSLDAFTNATLKQLGQFVTGYRLISQQKTTLGGVPARQIAYTGQQGKFKLHLVQVFTLRGAKFFVVTLTATESQFKASEAAGMGVIQSFKFTR